MTVEYGVSFKEMRAAFSKTPGTHLSGIDVGGENELMEPFNGMAKDVALWFRPFQNWRLTDIRTALITRDRIAQDFGEQTERTVPDGFEVSFHFDSNTPPVLWGRIGEAIGFGTHLGAVFAPAFRDKVHPDVVGYSVVPEKVGLTYPLPEALERLDNPYYLKRATVTMGGHGLKSVVASVFLEDIHDYLEMAQNKYRNMLMKLEVQES